MTIPPHNFTHSPVDEVTISLCYGEESPPVEIVIPSPYPGWGPIRERLEEIIQGLPGDTFHTGMLRYTDCFPLNPGDIPSDLVVIAPGIPSFFRERNISSPFAKSTISCIIPDAEADVLYTQSSDRIKLVFTVRTHHGSVYDKHSALTWFDQAREAVHQMFDAVTKEELVERVR